MIPTAELHVHLDGTIMPGLLRSLARRHKVSLPADIFEGEDSFAWNDIDDLHRIQDLARGLLKTPADWRDTAFDYLARCAGEGAIYVELTCVPDHSAKAGLDYDDVLGAVGEAIADAKTEFGIESRIVVAALRKAGKAAAEKLARIVAERAHQAVVGFTLSEDAEKPQIRQFAKAFAIARAAGLFCTLPVGEKSGPEAVREAVETLPITRIGHGVRAIEDRTVVRELAAREIVLECCPASNIASHCYASYDDHPLPMLQAAGVAVTLNSDEPAFLATSIGDEYEAAKRHFCLGGEDLTDITRTAIEASFADDRLKSFLLRKLAVHVD